MTRGLCIIVFAILGCASEQATAKNVTLDPAPTASASASSSSPIARPASFSIRIANAKEHTVDEVKDDGTILFNGRPKGKLIDGRVEELNGTLVMTINGNASMTFLGFNRDTFVVKLNDKDEIVMPDGAKMFITDAGLVTLYETNGALAAESGNSTVLAFRQRRS